MTVLRDRGGGVGATVLWLALAACADEAPPVVTCADLSTVRTCAGEACEERRCRGDELCSAGACAPLEAAPLAIDLEVRPADRPSDRWFRVIAPDVPEAAILGMRFDFGDGTAGWGRIVRHRFARGGVYPVELEVLLRHPSDPFTTLRRTASRLVEIEGDDGPLAFFTVNDYPEYLNGSVPYRTNRFTPNDPADDGEESFHVLVPHHGFTLDLTLLDGADRRIDRGTISITADRDLGGGAIPAGANLADRFVFPASGVPKARFRPGPSEALPDGLTTFTFSASAGDETIQQRFPLEAFTLDAAHLPFQPAMVWLFRYDLDYFTLAPGRTDDGAILLETTLAPNGVPDFLEELRAIGAASDDAAAGAKTVSARGRTGASAVFHAWFHERLAAELVRTYLGAPMTIFADGDAGAPDPSTFSRASGFSMMRLGGKLEGNLGRSYFAPYNEGRVDDTEPDLGVGTASLLQLLMGAPGLREVFAPIHPDSGTPVGRHDLDAVVLAADFDPHDPALPAAERARHAELDAIVGLMALVLASVTGHEMGHAMGLVPNGPPPDGYFGGRADVEFMGSNTDSHHADFPGLNVMQSGGNFLAVISQGLERIDLPEPEPSLRELVEIFMRETRLSPYVRAYVRGEGTYKEFR